MYACLFIATQKVSKAIDILRSVKILSCFLTQQATYICNYYYQSLVMDITSYKKTYKNRINVKKVIKFLLHFN